MEVGQLPQEFDVVCLGGGVAGEAIAAGLKGSGLTLVVVERELVGGECAYWGCVPSKTLLRSGETLAEAARARGLAASRVDWELDFPKISKRVLWMARDLDDTRPAAAMEANGAKLVRGQGKVVDQRTVEVADETFVARQALVVANGSTAAIPPISGLDTVDYDLDVVVHPDLTWNWKDEEEFVERLAYPFYWVENEAAVRAEGERLIKIAEAGQFPFDGTMTDFQPDPAWPVMSEMPSWWEAPRAWAN